MGQAEAQRARCVTPTPHTLLTPLPAPDRCGRLPAPLTLTLLPTFTLIVTPPQQTNRQQTLTHLHTALQVRAARPSPYP